MFRAILLQLAAVAVVTALCALTAGVHGGVSAALGGLMYALPSLFFALYLNSSEARRRRGFASSFLLGEAVKLVVFAVFLYVIVTSYADVHWLSLLLGLACATQAMFFAFWKMN